MSDNDIPKRAASLAEVTSAFGSQVAPFVHAYVQSWKTYKPNWNYEDGCIWKGCLDLADASGQRFLADFVYAEVSARVDCNGAIRGYDPGEFNIDNINPGKVLASLFERSGEPRFRKAIDAQMAQLTRHPQTQSGNYWHKQIYPNQVWLDGLYMAQPFRCSVAVLTDDAAMIADVVRQFDHVQAHLRDSASGLLYHGWDESRAERWSNPETGCSPNFWVRAMGWYAMALVDCIDVLNAARSINGCDAAIKRLSAILVEVADALMRVRSESGLWYQVLDWPDEPGNYEEASGSLMIAYVLMKASRFAIVDRQTGEAGRHALKTCIDRFLDEFHLHAICGVAGLGNTPYRDGSVGYYLSEPIIKNDPKGVAALLMALAEALR